MPVGAQTDQRIPQVVDGFSYNPWFTWAQERFFPNALAHLDILRRASNLRTRWWVVPDDINQPIEPYDTLYVQTSVAAGSYLWGYNFAALSATDPDGAPTEVAATDLLIQAVDSCTGVPLFMDFAIGGGCSSNGNSKMRPMILSVPRIILEPGLVNVEISNRTANTIRCQWLLMFAESCKLINEDTRERDWTISLLEGGTTNA